MVLDTLSGSHWSLIYILLFNIIPTLQPPHRTVVVVVVAAAVVGMEYYNGRRGHASLASDLWVKKKMSVDFFFFLGGGRERTSGIFLGLLLYRRYDIYIYFFFFFYSPWHTVRTRRHTYRAPKPISTSAVARATTCDTDDDDDDVAPHSSSRHYCIQIINNIYVPIHCILPARTEKYCGLQKTYYIENDLFVWYFIFVCNFRIIIKPVYIYSEKSRKKRGR